MHGMIGMYVDNSGIDTVERERKKAEKTKKFAEKQAKAASVKPAAPKAEKKAPKPEKDKTADAYDPSVIEGGRYEWWEERGLFLPEFGPDNKVKPAGSFVIDRKSVV